MTAAELTDRIRAADLGTAIDVDAVENRLRNLTREALYAVMEGCTAEFSLRRSLTKTELLRRVRNRLTARERAILRNSV